MKIPTLPKLPIGKPFSDGRLLLHGTVAKETEIVTPLSTIQEEFKKALEQYNGESIHIEIGGS